MDGPPGIKTHSGLPDVDGAPPEELARECEPTEPTIRTWLAQADRDQVLPAGSVTSAEKEIRRLRRETKILRSRRIVEVRAARIPGRAVARDWRP